jgi:CheY-like chemotaxis protein
MTAIRILIVEDEIVIGRHLQQILNTGFSQEFNVETQLAITPAKAVAVVPDFLPQLILCDINLNNTQTNGIELIDNLQKNYHFETVFITSYQSKMMIEQASLVRLYHQAIRRIAVDSVARNDAFTD